MGGMGFQPKYGLKAGAAVLRRFLNHFIVQPLRHGRARRDISIQAPYPASLQFLQDLAKPSQICAE